MEKRELAFNLYKESNGEKPLKDIASEIEASPGTVRGWKSRYKWDELIGKVTPETQRNDATKKRSATRNVAKQKKPKLVIENDNLTEQQKMFCLFYLQSFNATQSYLKAYECDYNSARAAAPRLLANVSVKEEIHKLKAELQQDMLVDVQDLIQEYAKQSFADIKDVTTFGTEMVEMDDGSEREYSFVRLKPDSEVDGTVIQEIKQGRDGTSVKLYDKQKAMSELMKYFEKTSGEDSTSKVIITRRSGDDDS